MKTAAAAPFLSRPEPRQVRLFGALTLATALVALAPVAFAQTPATPAETAAKAPAEAPTPKPAEAAAPAAAPQAKPAKAAQPAPEKGAAHATAELHDAKGEAVGSVRIADTASGRLHVIADLKGLPAGVHGMHIHEVGKCDAPSFESAGGHLAGGHKHGIDEAGGIHLGDMPNITVPKGGALQVEYFLSGVKVADVADADGGAVIVHAKPDDYKSQPSGAAGDRIGCGVFGAAK